MTAFTARNGRVWSETMGFLHNLDRNVVRRVLTHNEIADREIRDRDPITFARCIERRADRLAALSDLRRAFKETAQ